MLAIGGVRRRAWPVAVALSVLVLPILAAPANAELLAQRGRVVTEPEPANPGGAPPQRQAPPSPTVNTPPPRPPQAQPGKLVTEPEPAGPASGGPASPAPPWAPPPTAQPQPPPQAQPQPRPTPANDPNPRPDVNPPSSEACRRFPNLC